MKKIRNDFRKGKTIIVLSDLHLGAGEFFNEKRNLLEDFFFDNELIDFLHHFSSGIYIDRPVELILNGDIFDFLATPFIESFDDTFWSEENSAKKLDIIYQAHREVFNALKSFLHQEGKTITYIPGNHDSEMILPLVQNKFLEFFPKQHQTKIYFPTCDTYDPLPGITVMHGHQHEKAHAYEWASSIIKDQHGKQYLLPTWGSYYCLTIINKYKIERSYINQIQPIKKFLTHGLLYDTLFTLRFMFSNASFFIMIRLYLWYFYLLKLKFNKIIQDMKDELLMFQNYETIAKKYFNRHPLCRMLLMGHNHHPSFTHFKDGTTFINTGTWTKIISLDFSFHFSGHMLTFAKIDAKNTSYDPEDFAQNITAQLHEWKGDRSEPYDRFT